MTIRAVAMGVAWDARKTTNATLENALRLAAICRVVRAIGIHLVRARLARLGGAMDSACVEHEGSLGVDPV